VDRPAEAFCQENFTGTITSTLCYSLGLDFRQLNPMPLVSFGAIPRRFTRDVNARQALINFGSRDSLPFTVLRRSQLKASASIQSVDVFPIRPGPTLRRGCHILSKCKFQCISYHLAILTSKRKANFNFHIRTARPPWGRYTALPDDVDHSLRQRIMSIWGIANSVVIQIHLASKLDSQLKTLPHKHMKEEGFTAMFSIKVTERSDATLGFINTRILRLRRKHQARTRPFFNLVERTHYSAQTKHFRNSLFFLKTQGEASSSLYANH
jgi:hypothetical protein